MGAGPSVAQAPTSKVAAAELTSAEPQPDGESDPTNTQSKVIAPQAMASLARVQAAATPVAVPSLRPWPTAFDPVTVVTYLTGIVSSLVNAVLSPFAAGLPALPVDPSAWSLLAWVRRELFNESPTLTYNPVQNTQSLDDDGDVVVTGRVVVSDQDQEPHTFTVIGRPHNGGTVEIDEDGNFTYRPMNAMAAVGGTDSFTVVASDEAAGFHLHGPLGLLQFVPILGSLLNPSAGHRVAKTITVDVTAVDGVDLSFPDDFDWGVAHAGFQAEGGPGSPVDPNSDWYRWVHDPINQLLGLTKGVPEDGPARTSSTTRTRSWRAMTSA